MTASKHQLIYIEECSLSNSGICWNEGYNRAYCSCGWVSIPIRENDGLIALHESHTRIAILESRAKGKNNGKKRRKNVV